MENNTMDNKCNICSTDLHNGQNIVVKLLCRHEYHYDCIKPWYKLCAHPNPGQMARPKPRQCPYCRKSGGYLPLPDTDTFDKDLHHPNTKKTYNRCGAELTSKKGKCKNRGLPEYHGHCKRHKDIIKIIE